MRFQQRLKPCHNLIDLTPLVDVIFLLLIFFLVTSEILPLKSLLIETPQLKVDQPAKLAQLIVIMDSDHVIYLGSKKEIVDMGSVQERLKEMIASMKEQNPDSVPTIVLSIDKRVDYGQFLRLFSQVQECSSRIRLAFKPKV
ncbi:MAG: biopolymer transporter ExbD [Verrucomicrobia bacterium]|nr:biopolymer transporter ExbD [Verrucomicrobiota bacterium]MBS0637225.1 biopolymer transporter ExbD [Verrucomicrobiota bacterium]